jgi:hypothetical protein
MTLQKFSYKPGSRRKGNNISRKTSVSEAVYFWTGGQKLG